MKILISVQPPIDPTQLASVNPWQTIAWQAAVFTALLTAIVALAKGIWALKDQRREYRWRQAELARQLVDRWFEWKASDNALRMVDEGENDYSLEGYGTHHISPKTDIPQALKITQTPNGLRVGEDSPKDRFIRKCFDVLLYGFQRVQHSIDSGVVRLEDVTSPARYYVKQLGPFRRLIDAYAEHIGFSLAKKFMDSMT